MLAPAVPPVPAPDGFEPPVPPDPPVTPTVTLHTPTGTVNVETAAPTVPNVSPTSTTPPTKLTAPSATHTCASGLSVVAPRQHPRPAASPGTSTLAPDRRRTLALSPRGQGSERAVMGLGERATAGSPAIAAGLRHLELGATRFSPAGCPRQARPHSQRSSPRTATPCALRRMNGSGPSAPPLGTSRPAARRSSALWVILLASEVADEWVDSGRRRCCSTRPRSPRSTPRTRRS